MAEALPLAVLLAADPVAASVGRLERETPAAAQSLVTAGAISVVVYQQLFYAQVQTVGVTYWPSHRQSTFRAHTV